MDTKYIIRAALHEETNNGWIWVCGPSLENLQSRAVVKISRPGHCRGVYTEVRKIDDNFLGQYNHDPITRDPENRQIDIVPTKDTIVMAEWYRVALAIWDTTECDDELGTVPLCVKEVRPWGYKSLCAACHHPDPVVRLSTRLGILGTWLGLLALTDTLLKMYEHFDGNYDRFWYLKHLFCLSGTTEYLHAWAMMVIMLALAALGVWACWGRPRPRRR